MCQIFYKFVFKFFTVIFNSDVHYTELCLKSFYRNKIFIRHAAVSYPTNGMFPPLTDWLLNNYI